MNELEEALAGIGHNNPPAASEAENIVERLIERNNDMIARYGDLCDAISRLPKECANEEDAQKVTSFGNMLKACHDTLEERRKLEKKPYDDQANAVHQFFKSKTDTLAAHITSVKLVLKKYLDAQAEKKRQDEIAARKAADEEAERKRQEAEQHLKDAAALQDAGMSASAEVSLEQAQVAENQATAAMAVAVAPVKPSTVNVRGTVGGMAGSTGRVKGEVVDMATVDLEFLRQYLSRDDVTKALNAYLKVAIKQLKKDDPLPTVKGCNIARETSVTLRG